MTKRRYFIISAIYAIYLVFFIPITIAENNLLGNIFSPIGAFLAAYSVFRAYRVTGMRYKNWLLVALACFAWGSTDVLWAIYDAILKIDPNESKLLMWLYCLPNIFLAGVVILFYLRKRSQRNNMQTIVDLTATLVVLAGATYLLFFADRLSKWIAWNAESITTIIYLVTDLVILACVFITFIIRKNKKINLILRLALIGMELYAITDIIYVYEFVSDQYVPNSMVDGFYIISLLIFGYTGVQEELLSLTDDGDNPAADMLPENIGSHKIWFAILIPIVIYLTQGLSLGSIVFFMAVIAAHQILTLYVKFYIQNEYMLKQNRTMNEILENRIEERTRELTELNEELRIISTQDVITGLYNRRYFVQKLDEMIGQVQGTEKVYLLYMDLDRFKSINDTYGHDIGDLLLKIFAKRLQEVNREGMLCARLGGDEFVIAFLGEFDKSDVELLAVGIYSLCEQPIFVEHYALQVSMSIGIACYPEDAGDRNELMKYSDIAMYNAKGNTHQRYSFFNSWLSDNVRRKNEVELQLSTIDFDREFHLYYQPQFRVKDQKLVGMEALLRWNSPQIGMVSPAEFIPLAEEVGMIIAIGDWVMQRAVKQISLWNGDYGCNLKMGINVSVKQIDGARFLDTMRNCLVKNVCVPEWVDIEITESGAMSSESAIEEILTALAGLGVSISIDDFGTGYSSLSYIKRFDIDRLKIAKPLIDEITKRGSADLQIIKAIIMMAKAMELKTIAEGVETKEQFQQLHDLGCDEIQGYFLGRPVPAEIFEEVYLNRELIKNSNSN